MRADVREVLRSDYKSFLRKAYREEHGQPLGPDPYVTRICDGLHRLKKTDGARLVINLPPRHGKTLFAAVYYAAWLLGQDARLKIIIITYSGELAEQITFEIRKIMRSAWYRSVFATRLQKDRQRVGHFVTNLGGSVFATSINGVIAGVGADYIICDDLLGLRDASDLNKVEAVNRIFDGELTSRLNTPSKGRIIVIAHRLHDNDLSAHLKNAPKTTHVVLPLVAPRQTRIRLSTGIWDRAKGELLRRRSHTEAAIEKLMRTSQPSFELYYQQGVAGSERRLSSDHFRTYNPNMLSAGPIVISVDTAVKAGPDNSYTVMQVWAPRDDGFFLIEQFRAQCRHSESVQTLHGLVRRFRPNVVLIEDRANGTNLIDTMKRRTRTPIVAVNPGQDSKIQRMARHVALIRKRPVFLPEDYPERQAFIDEILGRGGSTDQMDALSQMLDFVTNHVMPPTPPPRALYALGTAQSSSAGVSGIAIAFHKRR